MSRFMIRIFTILFLWIGNIVNGHVYLWSAYDIPVLFRENNFRSTCPQPFGQFSHPKYCDFFLNCWQGSATIARCQHNLVFNEKIRACDYKYNVDCMGKPISYEKPTLDPRCKESTGTFVTSADCSEYVICNDGSASSYKCPQGTYYNTFVASCRNERPDECSNQEVQPIIEAENPIRPTAETQTPIPEIQTPKPDTTSPRPQKPSNERPVEVEVASDHPTPETIHESTSPPPDFNPPPPSDKPELKPIPGLIPRPTSIPQKPKPEVTQPTTQKPDREPIPGLKPKPQPSIGQSTSTEYPSVSENSSPHPIENIPDEDIVGPSRPIAAGTPTIAPTPAETQFRPKPPLLPDSETQSPDPAHPQSEEPSTSTITTVPLKPKPPLTPESEEEQPVVDVSNVKPKPAFQPPASKPNPGEAPTPRPPILNPDSFKPQKPPGENFGPSSTPAPVDGEDDPHILFPFLPQFPDSFRCPVNTVLLPIVGDCNSVIACINGKGQQLRCPKGQHFNIIQGVCSTQRNFICQKISQNHTKENIIYGYLPVSVFNRLLNSEIERIGAGRNIITL